MHRFYPEIDDWYGLCNELCRLPEEATSGPDQSGRNRAGRSLHMGVVGRLGGPRRFQPSFTTGTYDKYFFRGPYSSDCVWNMADSVSPRREANLLSLVNMGSALRSMGKQDQDRYKFQMTHVLSRVCSKTSSKRNDGHGKKQ